MSLTKKTTDWLIDTEISFSHRKVNKVSLVDIYTPPDIELNDVIELNDKANKIRNSIYIIKNLSSFLIAGDEQQGKTSLLKYFYKELLEINYFPVYLNAKDISGASVESYVFKCSNEQYENINKEEFNKKGKIVILLDNINDIKLNNKFRSVFMKELNNTFPVSILTCHPSFNYVISDFPELNNHSRVSILGLGHKKREELLQKWISLGVEENIKEEDLYSKCDDLKIRLNTIIKNNIVPSKPIYILMLLQMFEANGQLNLELTSYGHCYQQLIYQSFENANIKKQDFDKYLNVLTELAWWIFKNEKDPNAYDMDAFFVEYVNNFLKVDEGVFLSKMTKHSIIEEVNACYRFKYPYIYYYFVGKKIADSYSDSDTVKEHTNKLLSLIHREDFANILIFITHHTKNSWVLTEIKNVLQELFIDQDVASLHKKELLFMEEFVKKIPELIIEQREIQKERDIHNERLDKLERNKSNQDHYEPNDLLARINKTFKGMEIAGQIIRNRNASLTRKSLLDLARSGVFSGLRFLDYFIKVSDSSKNEIIKVISNHLIEHPNLTNGEIVRFAEYTYLHITYNVINAIVIKIAESIGSKEAIEIYKALETEIKTPVLYLINQAIELKFNKSLKMDSVYKCKENIKDNPVCVRILKEMVIQHTYMFPVNYRDKQQLAELLEIPVNGQRLMDFNKIGKEV